MWIFVVDRPYYPSVDEYGTKNEAEEALSAFLAEEGEDDGTHTTIAYVAEVSRRRTTKTHH